MKRDELIKYWREQDRKYQESAISEPTASTEPKASVPTQVVQIQSVPVITSPPISMKLDYNNRVVEVNGSLSLTEVTSLLAWIDINFFKKSESLPPSYTK